MSKFLIIVSLIFSCGLALAYEIDLTGGRAEVASDNSITLHNVKFGGISAVWAKLVWNPEVNAFKLVEFGDDGGRTHDTSLAGIWRLSFDWGCDGSAASSTWHLNEDGTCSDAYGNNCIWSYENGQFTLDYGRNVGAYYKGLFNRAVNTLTGTMRYGETRGCWNADRVMKEPHKKESPRQPKASGKNDSGSPMRP